ncbi:Vacuolar-sorting_protein SNF8 [Hexamita inflata]|uniref:Vacuolar-sorting protein SNF8 n=1 Tax=Hexamita inflata TaxID=28002 RepID=A0AA86PXK3_9EUKA|nr:Vacuolar-sorting protein SNF8 [Hexamita inflata]CAI9971338.1 Vacuolar-sorting protein SNF8 [Hexamita inflata]
MSLLFSQLNQQAINQSKTNQNMYFEKTAQIFKKFQLQLEQFAQENLHKIDKDKDLRQQFSQLCTELGIDPLSSSSSIFSKLIGNFYFTLATKLMDYCDRQQSSQVLLANFISDFNKKLIQKNQISKEDVLKTIKIIQQLSPDYKIEQIKGQDYLVFSSETTDQDMLAFKQFIGSKAQPKFKLIELQQEMKWTEQKAELFIEKLILEGLLANDNQTNGGWANPDYWFIQLV